MYIIILWLKKLGLINPVKKIGVHAIGISEINKCDIMKMAMFNKKHINKIYYYLLQTYLRLRLIIYEIFSCQDEPSLFVVNGHETFFVLWSFHHQTLFDDVTVVHFVFTSHHDNVSNSNTGKLIFQNKNQSDWKHII